MIDIDKQVKMVLAGVLANGIAVDDLSSTADLVDDYGLDSLQMISFLLGIEDVLDVELDYEALELDDLRSIEHFVAYLTALVREVVR